MLLETLEDVLLDQLRDLYSIETQIEVAVPIIAEQSRTPALRDALTEHFEAAEEQIVRLQEIFGTLGVSARGPRCLGIAGLLQETEDTMRRCIPGALLDAVAISCLRRVQQYKITAYGSAASYAKRLRQIRIAELLEQSRGSEAGRDHALERLAQSDLLGLDADAGVLIN